MTNNNNATETFDVAKAIEAQAEYCRTHNLPYFAPVSGRCSYCYSNIYVQQYHSNGRTSGISVEKAGTELITGCPHCHKSYCD